MKYVLFAQQSSHNFTIVYNTQLRLHLGSVTVNGKEQDYEVVYFEQQNKVEAQSILAQLKNAEIVLKPELYSKEKIVMHRAVISSLTTFINQNWPDYEQLYKESLIAVDNCLAVNKELYNEIEALGFIVRKNNEDQRVLKAELSKARAKIVALKKK